MYIPFIQREGIMKIRLEAGTQIEVIDYDMLMHVDYRNWTSHTAKKTQVFDEKDFLSSNNTTKRDFPGLLCSYIRDKRPNMIILKAKNYEGKEFYAKVSKHKLFSEKD